MVIKSLRLEKGLSQEDLSQITNLSTRTIQRIEKSDSGSLESLNAIAVAFDLNYNQLQEKIKNKNVEIKNSNSDFLFNDKKVVIFIFVNILLFIINMLTNPNTLWFIYPLLGWGIPLFWKRYKKSFNIQKKA